MTADNQVYGAPWGGFMAGAVLYNSPVYTKLGLQVPKTWAEFMANNAKIKAAGVAPVIQTYGETWTSQLFVLGDFHNVAAAEPDFADKYTKNKAKYATSPAALKGFQHLQAGARRGLPEQGLRLGQVPDGLRMLAQGKGAQYPILSAVVSQHGRELPRRGQRRRPVRDARRRRGKNGLTVWTPGRRLHPEDHDRRQAGRGQEVPGLHRQPGRVRLADRRGRADRPVRGQGLHAAGRRTAGR